MDVKTVFIFGLLWSFTSQLAWGVDKPAVPAMPIVLAGDTPGFYIDVGHQVHPGEYSASDAGGGSTVYNLPSSKYTPSIEVNKADGKINYVAYFNHEKHDFSILSLDRGGKLQAQTNCYSTVCYNVTPMLCHSFLKKAGISSFQDILTKQKQCDAIARSLEESMHDPAIARDQKAAWTMNLKRLKFSPAYSKWPEFLRKTFSVPDMELRTNYTQGGSGISHAIAEVCAKYDSGQFLSPLVASQNNEEKSQ